MTEGATGGIARLTKPGDYASVYGRGKSWANRILALRTAPNSLNYTRCGFAVGEKIGGAVTRNKIKRRLREIIRGMTAPPGWDIVVVARKPAAEIDYQTLHTALVELMEKAGLQNNLHPLQ